MTVHEKGDRFPDLGDMATATSLSGHDTANGGAQRWTPRRETGGSSSSWSSRSGSAGSSLPSSHGHARQSSISDAMRRVRKGSIGQANIAGALRAPISPTLVALCIIWWTTSLLTNTTSKSILNVFPKPATLTIVQFVFVASYCFIWSSLAAAFPQLKQIIPALKYPLRSPSRDVIRTTLPMALFQIGGHLLSTNATSMIPVSLVHTIKGLSPLFTVLAYRILYNIPYPAATYISLVPLTLGVFLACSGNISFDGQFLGVIYALLAAIIFVTQNIYSKQLFNERAKAEAEGLGMQSKKLDKLNLLFYSSGLAFVLTIPIWLFSEGWTLVTDSFYDGASDLTGNSPPGHLVFDFFLNGSFHFGQNLIAFVLLGMVSPVTYSVASLIKRVYIIVASLIWFRNPTSRVQAFGIALTFLGLWLYDRSNEGNKADRKVRSMSISSGAAPLLPMNTKTSGASSATAIGAMPYAAAPVAGSGYGYVPPATDMFKKQDAEPARSSGPPSWLPPGTKQEDTWRLGDQQAGIVNGVGA
ncbi:hypothetical protein TD95_001675 [Thielaviopsis punctulata]|uniref:Sugar phosphate transporter domain-containing protein n=1 Tax=Thielaviopsis punctulata TaxID=72032 RepID=A0A0F4ZG38_9PEZI|nr:hypothetical protein TD95_001675 [Thielaviopsis punctulata]